MKIKLPSAKVIGMVLIGIMFVSTFAFSIIQSTIFGSRQQKIQPPKNRILNYYLSPQQKNTILNYGGSIITFVYPQNCQKCLNQKNYLESLTEKYNWLYLEEISSKVNSTTIYVLGVYGQKILENKSNEDVFTALCEVSYQAPLECALKQK
jgi:hypothetical protein